MKKIIAVLMTLCLFFTAAASFAEGEAYTNEKLGIAFTLPEGWQALSKEDMAAAVGVTADLLEDSEKLDEITGLAQELTVFSASDPVKGSSVAITMQEIPEAQKAVFASISEATLLEATGSTLPAMYESMGLTVSEPEYGTISFAGNSEKAYMTYTMTLPGMDVGIIMTQMFYFTETKIYTVTVGGISEEDIAVGISGFSAL